VIRVYDRLIQGLATLAGLIVAAVCLLIVFDVAARNLGMQPPASTVAITEYALLYITMMAAPYLVRTQGHIVVEILYQRLGSAARRILDRLVLSLCALISIVVALLAMILLIEAVSRGEIEVRSLDTPRWVLFAPLVVGFSLMGTEFLRLLLLGGSAVTPAAERRDSL